MSVPAPEMLEEAVRAQTTRFEHPLPEAAFHLAMNLGAIKERSPVLAAVIVSFESFLSTPAPGEEGLLQGRTILVKDNIETSEWATTAGSLALQKHAPEIRATLRRSASGLIGLRM